MGSVDVTAGLHGVDSATIVLSFVFLTVPGIALAKGLTRFRKPRTAKPGTVAIPKPGTPGATANQANRPKKLSFGNWIATVLTVAAVLVAGLGLVPLAKVGFGMVTGYEYGPALTGLVAVVLVLAKVIAMIRDLRDGKVDHPMLWLAPVPLIAMIVWAGPVVWGQAKDQASQTGQMIFGGGPKDDTKKEANKEPHKKPHTKATHHADNNGGE